MGSQGYLFGRLWSRTDLSEPGQRSCRNVEATTVRGKRVYRRLLKRCVRNRNSIQRQFKVRFIGSRSLSVCLRPIENLCHHLQIVRRTFVRIIAGVLASFFSPVRRSMTWGATFPRPCFITVYQRKGVEKKQAHLSALPIGVRGVFFCQRNDSIKNGVSAFSAFSIPAVSCWLVESCEVRIGSDFKSAGLRSSFCPRPINTSQSQIDAEKNVFKRVA